MSSQTQAKEKDHGKTTWSLQEKPRAQPGQCAEGKHPNRQTPGGTSGNVEATGTQDMTKEIPKTLAVKPTRLLPATRL